MKILQVFDYFSPTHGGGTVNLLYQLSKTLAQRGHDVTIYTSDFELDQGYVDSLKGITVHLFHCWSRVAGFFLMPSMLGEIKRSLSDFDIIHMHSQRSFQNIVIHHYAKKYGVPFIIDAHGSTPRTVVNKKGFKWLLKWLFDIIFGNRILNDASRVIAESEVGINEYKEIGIGDHNKIVLITPLRNISEFMSLPAHGIFRNKFNLQEKHIVMFLGRINWIKGIDFLIESFNELVKVRNDVVLMIVGPDDGHKLILEKLIKQLQLSEEVIFTGFLGGQDKLSALVDANVVVQTSIYEQGAWAPYEAVLCNTPIIVSSNSGAGEDVCKMDTGYLVEYGNINELRDIIQYVLNNPAEVAVKTKKAKKYIEDNLSLEHGIIKYENIYAECIAQNNLFKECKK